MILAHNFFPEFPTIWSLSMSKEFDEMICSVNLQRNMSLAKSICLLFMIIIDSLRLSKIMAN